MVRLLYNIGKVYLADRPRAAAPVRLARHAGRPVQKEFVVSKTARRLSFPPMFPAIFPLMLAMALAAPAAQARADSVAAISFAEQPVRLLRATSFYLAARGAHLQDGDIVDTGASGIQIDGDGAATLAIGPGSRVYFKLAGGALTPTLLEGWLKIQPGAQASARAVMVSAGALQFNAAGLAAIIHLDADKAELFVESGEAAVIEKAGAKALAPVKVGRELYAVRGAKLPLKVVGRPPKDFVGAMPPAFFDKLIPVAARGPAPAPKLDRPALFTEVAPWLAGDSALYQLLDRRFNPVKVVPAASVPRPETHVY